jgi:dTDP-4-amino-4,6-dideoxygalactose transaminase
MRVLRGRRDQVRAALAARDIETGIHYKPAHLLARFGGGRISLAAAEQLYGEILSLPLHPALADVEVDTVIAAVRQALERGASLT